MSVRVQIWGNEGISGQLLHENGHETNSALGNSQGSSSRSSVRNRLISRTRKLLNYCYCALVVISKKIKSVLRRFPIIVSMIGLLSDPLLMYMFSVSRKNLCYGFDPAVGIVACFLLTGFDIHYIILKLDNLHGEGSRRYWLLLFHAVSILPITQVTVIILRKPKFMYDGHVAALYLFLLFQHLRRLIPVFKWSRKKITSGKLGDWFLVFCFCYLYFSQIYGAIWYSLALNKQYTCWIEACEKEGKGERDECIARLNGCKLTTTEAHRIDKYCDVKEYNYGIALEAVKNGLLDFERSKYEKILYCFRQGSQNLSNFGQSLEAVDDVLGNLYTILAVVFGILSFSFLVGMFQLYQQSSAKRFGAREKKLKEIKNWLPFQVLSMDLQSQIKKSKKEKWQEIKVVNLENMFRNLTEDLRVKWTCDLCFELLRKVEEFQMWSDEYLEEVCHCLKPFSFAVGTRIIKEGDPIDEMVFVVQGQLWTYTKAVSLSIHDRRRTSGNDYLGEGDVCGKELVNWIQADSDTSDLPISPKTFQAVTKVEAFVLMAYDLKRFIKHQETETAFLYGELPGEGLFNSLSINSPSRLNSKRNQLS